MKLFLLSSILSVTVDEKKFWQAFFSIGVAIIVYGACYLLLKKFVFDK